jgi:hypothetical protein
MNRRRACLAALILAPWLAFAGAALVGYELLTGHRLLRVAAGCAVLVVAFEVGVATYRFLKSRPVLSRAEAVGRLRGRGWRPPAPGVGPPFGA